MSAAKKCLTPGSLGPDCMSLVPEIYVTPTDTDKNHIPGMAARRDSTNSNLSCSLPNLAMDDIDETDFVNNGNEPASKPKDYSLYCSPRPSRKNGEGKQKHHNGQPNYPFLKCIGKPYRERLESTDSNDSDCSASHQSTCATSDYTHLTSLDMINILSMREQYHSQLGSNMDLSEYGTLRRTHSNPENCVLTEEETKQNMESSDSSLRDSKSCTNLEAQMAGASAANVVVVHGSHLKPEAQRPTQLVQSGNENNVNTALLHAGSKSLAVSEENLLSRVNRWLGSVETDEGTNENSKQGTS